MEETHAMQCHMDMADVMKEGRLLDVYGAQDRKSKIKTSEIFPKTKYFLKLMKFDR